VTVPIKYHLKAPDAEWEIERSGDESSWSLNKRTEGDWRLVGTYRCPNEAAVTVGAKLTVSSKRDERHLSRLRFVLSRWEAVEQC
jgi:hypothetical protein